MSLTCRVDDDGVLSFQDAEGNSVSEMAIERAKKQHRDAIMGLIQRKCEQINSELDALAFIHIETPNPDSPPSFQAQPYAESQPLPLLPPPPRWWERFLPGRLAKLAAVHQHALAEHETESSAWQLRKAQYENDQALKKRLITHGIYHDTTDMERWLEDTLQDIAWPQETLISLEIAEEGRHIFLDVDLPEIEAMPSKAAAMPARGLKLSVKELSATQLRKRYMAHVHGIAFRLIGETFAALPVTQCVTLSGFSQRHDPTTGQVRDDYLYSVRVKREDWARINFRRLEMIDVVESLAQFDLRRRMTSTGIFRPIDPFQMEQPTTVVT